MRKTEILGSILLLVFLFAIPFLIGFQRLVYGYAKYGLVAAKTWGMSWLLLSLLIFLVLIVFYFHRYSISRMNISLFKNGFKVHRIFRKDLTYHWDQITKLYVIQKKSSATDNYFQTRSVIYTSDKNRISLRDKEIPKLLELITQIKSSVYAYLNPKLHESMWQGKVLSFGALEIQKEYLRLKRGFLFFSSKQFIWRDINLITIKSGYLYINLQIHGQYRIPVSKIPNLEILLSIIDDRTRLQI